MSPDAAVRGEDGGLYGVDYKTVPFMSWIRTPIPMPIGGWEDRSPMEQRYLRCAGCGHKSFRTQELGCDCEAEAHDLCSDCVPRLTGDGTVLELGVERPVRLKVCPDGLAVARELMDPDAPKSFGGIFFPQVDEA